MIALLESFAYGRAHHREGWDPRTAEPCVCPDCGGKLVRSSEHNDKEIGKTTVFEFECKLSIEPGTPAPCVFACQATDEAREAYRLLVDGSASVVAIDPASEVVAQAHHGEAPPPEAPAEALPAVLELPELKEIENFRAELAEFMGAPIEKQIKDAIKVTEGLTVAKHVKGPKAGRDAVHSALMNLVRVRTQVIDPKKEKFKGPINSIARQIDGRYRELVAWLKPHEDRLEKERDEWDKAEKKRKDLEAEQARQAAQQKAQGRLDILVARGIAPDLTRAQSLPDDEWDIWLQAATDAAAVRRRVQEIADELTALGDPCVYVDAMALTEDEMVQRLAAAKERNIRREAAQKLADELSSLGDECSLEEALAIPEEAVAQRLTDARDAKDRRDEAERIELGKRRYSDVIDMDPELLIDGRPTLTAEELAALDLPAWTTHIAAVQRETEERGRRRLQLGADRTKILAELGMDTIPTQSKLSVLTETSFETIRSMAADAKVVRDEAARKDREDLARLRESERIAREAQEQKEADERAEADRLEAERLTREADEREARARPERERLAGWAREVLVSLPEVPEVKDPQNVSILARATADIQNALRAMRNALGEGIA